LRDGGISQWFIDLYMKDLVPSTVKTNAPPPENEREKESSKSMFRLQTFSKVIIAIM
jgi:hypothetical protein